MSPSQQAGQSRELGSREIDGEAESPNERARMKSKPGRSFTRLTARIGLEGDQPLMNKLGTNVVGRVS